MFPTYEYVLSYVIDLRLKPQRSIATPLSNWSLRIATMSADAVMTEELCAEVLLRGQKRAMDLLAEGCAAMTDKMHDMINDQFSALLIVGAQAMRDTIAHEVSRIVSKAGPLPSHSEGAGSSGSLPVEAPAAPPAFKIPEDFASILQTKLPFIKWNSNKRKFMKVRGAQVV